MVGAEAIQQEPRVTRAADFDEFYRRERAALYRALALTVRDPDVATEAVDEAMVRAYQNWWRIGGYDNPAGWVYRVALNWSISRARRRRRELWPEPPPPEPDCADSVLAAAVAALPDKQRAVVVLRFHMDWSLDQIAAALRIPTGTVKSRLHRSLATLRSELEDARRES